MPTAGEFVFAQRQVRVCPLSQGSGWTMRASAPVLELPLYTSPTSNANARGALGAFIARLSFLVLDSQWSGGLLHSTGRS